ncbi:tetratricopeptide repeat protein [Flagellatimonas centrodinii]|uniref:tetratricopeptide repeat protein n=1 Tax=Flagellatimonas centrodinii TaxID=2806210 RepID=UPI001FEF044D|nr:tetratricopeptide repeat protein [Flagellatimonas centrodinii]ULQ45355.1 tetratricopeptide repeat protein [Flagellatimonas centrodinii]
MMSPAKRLSSLLAILVLSGCSLPQRLGPPVAPTPTPEIRPVDGVRAGPVRLGRDSRDGERSEDQAIHSELIRGMLEQGQYYAAVAHVEAQRLQGGDTAELRWLEAEARRRLGQLDQARTGFESLLRSAYGARAEHGLGLIAAAEGRSERARGHLRNAVLRAPTVAEFRNDLGFAEMQQGQFEAALTQLATGVELAPEDTRIRSNLVLLLLTTGDRSRARDMATSMAMPEPVFTRLQTQADTLRRRLAATR